MAELGLDQVWWLVSPQNPLKPVEGMASFQKRMAGARSAARHPRIVVTDLERRLGTRYTADTLAALRRLYPRTRFVWLMGADNLGQIHRWQRWRTIFDSVPVAVFDRPAYGLRALAAPAAQTYRAKRVGQSRAGLLARRRSPGWVFFACRLENQSSTAIRQAKRPVAP
jgi:nicotinate-nucleotide adenylyltransferase